jgi:hypothetical protein
MSTDFSPGHPPKMNIKRQVLKLFGFDNQESLRTPLDVILGAAGGIAGLILLVFSFEKSPSAELHRAAVWSSAIIIAALVLAKNRVAVILSVVALVGFRGLLAVVLYGQWKGLLLAVPAGVLIYIATAGRAGGPDK